MCGVTATSERRRRAASRALSGGAVTGLRDARGVAEGEGADSGADARATVTLHRRSSHPPSSNGFQPSGESPRRQLDSSPQPSRISARISRVVPTALAVGRFLFLGGMSWGSSAEPYLRRGPRRPCGTLPPTWGTAGDRSIVVASIALAARPSPLNASVSLMGGDGGADAEQQQSRASKEQSRSPG